MGKQEKLIAKLKSGSISANELRTLLAQLGAKFHGARGSHEKYSLGERLFILATHTKEVPRYQIKQALEFLELK